ncbi:MAG: alpha/beta hydrolase [Clostridia bacterium]|nr:alpha/beta hydrolase [Clostridia bacterium]
MNYTKTEFSFPSVSGLADIHAAKYVPADAPKGIFQIVHGMAEHFERYEKFIDVLTANGFVVFTHDHLGHGKSVSDKCVKGYFGEGGYKTLVSDVAALNDIAKKEYPSLPYVLFGHSMGSFVVRCFAGTPEYNKKIDKLIACGTAGANPGAGIGIGLCNCIAAFKGEKHLSKMIDGIAFGSYNKKFEGRTNFDWLTKDNDIVDAYIADEDCGYLFTLNGYKGLFGALKFANSKECFAATPDTLPILLIAGADDPVGNYGKGVQEVYDKFKGRGINVDIKLYPNARHEILNESDTFDNVVADVLDFAK